jgi:hypothetical protein
VLRKAPAGAGIHAIKAANPPVLNIITGTPMPHSIREGDFAACVCMEELCRTLKVRSVRWRA